MGGATEREGDRGARPGGRGEGEGGGAGGAALVGPGAGRAGARPSPGGAGEGVAGPGQGGPGPEDPDAELCGTHGTPEQSHVDPTLQGLRPEAGCWTRSYLDLMQQDQGLDSAGPEAGTGLQGHGLDPGHGGSWSRCCAAGLTRTDVVLKF